MKLVKNFALAVLLAFVFAVSAPAGEIGTPAAAGPTASPTPHGATSSDETKSASYGDTDVVITAETSDYLFFEALAALLSVY